jgi:hypothetical protein
MWSRARLVVTLYLLIAQLSWSSLFFAATRSAPSKSTIGYASALAAADRFLQSWQTGDVETGIVLLTSDAKAKITRNAIEDFFSSAAPSAYEIMRGRKLRRGCYEFPVVLLQYSSRNSRGRRRLSTIVVLDTGNNDWAVDKLP